jgi:hypothetical protein
LAAIAVVALTQIPLSRLFLCNESLSRICFNAHNVFENKTVTLLARRERSVASEPVHLRDADFMLFGAVCYLYKKGRWFGKSASKFTSDAMAAHQVIKKYSSVRYNKKAIV